MKLNKCEQNLLKLVIPFVTVRHIPNSDQLKVVGSCIMVESDITDTLSKILPLDQQLIPVALKRRPEYRGSYVEQVVDKSKILKTIGCNMPIN